MNIFKTIANQSTFTRAVAYPGLIVLFAISIVCALCPEWTNEALQSVQTIIYRDFSWLYVLLVSSFFIFLVVLAFGKTGSIRLGADNSSPQYSFFSWIAMLFAAGMGIGLMYFGVAEPMSHYVHPPLSEVANPAKEAQLLTFFHWGIHAWSIFALIGLVLAYFSFRYRLPLAIRSGLYPLLGERIKGPIGNIVDTFALVSTFFGIATSMGFGVVQLNAGLAHLGIAKESSFVLQCIIICVVSAIAIWSAVAGVSKGVKRLSEANLTLAILLMVFILILGPTSFLLSAFSEGLGYYLQRFFELTFTTYAFEEEGHQWFSTWTITYWAWWISWAPFVGLFIARISKGRTIREFILAVLFAPSLFVFLWMTIFGNSAIHIDMHSAAGSLSRLVSNPDVLLFSFFEQFPLATPLCILAVLMIAIFFVTSADSGILVMNSIASGNRPHSPKWQTAFWGVLLAIIAMVMLYMGGLQSLQTMTLIAALPFGLIMLALCVSLVKALHTDILYHRSRVPYGSQNWDGRLWRKRLSQVLTFSQKTDIQLFLREQVRPAFEALAQELTERGITTEIAEGKRGKMSIEIVIQHDKIWNFKYGVLAERRDISDYLLDEDNTPDVNASQQYIPLTYYSDGRTGNNIQYLSREEIIADVLREYERYISIIADDSKALMFTDKGEYMIK